jgi:transposase
MYRRRQYSSDFKRMVVDEFLTGGASQVALEKKYGIGGGGISRWVREFQAHKDEAFPGSGHLRTGEQELAALRRQVQNLTEQNSILKKVLQIVSQSPTEPTA